MDAGRLRTLRELSIRGTMAAVADAVHLSPSAVSQQIAQLEEEVGLDLVERRGRGVHLTPAGRRLVEYAERILGVLEEAEAEMAELKRIVAGEFRIAAFPSVAAALIPQTIQMLQIAHPQLSVVFDELEPHEGLAALRAWQTDAALIDDLTTPPTMLNPTFEVIHLMDDRLYALLPGTHRLATQEQIALSDLHDENWAIETGSGAYSDVVVRACERAGFYPRINATCNGFEVVRALVESQCSVSIVPGLQARSVSRQLAVRPLLPPMHRKISVAFRKSDLRRPTITAFLQHLMESASNFPQPF